MEIERKYLINHLPENLNDYPVKIIEQGYLCTSPVVRIRKSNERYILTYKSKQGVSEQESVDSCVNQEVEVPLTKDGYEHLKEKIDDHLISKDRHVVLLEDGHTAELDVFHGRLEGLVFVEVEFKDAQDMETFHPPEWFGENVSSDRRYSNSFLSKCDSLDDFNDSANNC